MKSHKLIKTFLYPLLAIAISSMASARDAVDVQPLLIGATVPDVSLVDQSGQEKELAEITKGKHSVILFYRGGWCPFCNRQLEEVAEIEGNLIDLGFQIIAISPDSPQSIAKTDDKLKVNYALFSDSKMRAADAFGISFELTEATLKKLKRYNIDIEEASDGLNKDRLPVPSVFIVTPKNEISFTYVDPNYKYRAPAELVLAAAKSSKRFHKK